LWIESKLDASASARGVYVREELMVGNEEQILL
jgi:hypothetical protein